MSRHEYSISYQRPNKLSLELLSGLSGITIECDGSQLEWTDYPSKKRSKLVAPQTCDALDLLLPKGACGRMRSSLSILYDMLHSTPYLSIQREYPVTEYVGIETRGLFACHVLKLYGKYDSLKIWVHTGDKPLIEGIDSETENSDWIVHRNLSDWSLSDQKTE